MKELLGKVVREAWISPDSNLIRFLGDDLYYLYAAEGDCCAVCYFYQMQDFDLVIGEEILGVEEGEWKDISGGEGDVVEQCFYMLKTRKGRATFEVRLEHNGYYSGWVKFISDKNLATYSKMYQKLAILDERTWRKIEK